MEQHSDMNGYRMFLKDFKSTIGYTTNGADDYLGIYKIEAKWGK
jgi:hypothetical protein